MSAVKAPAFRYRLLSLVLLPFWIIHAAWLAVQTRQPDYFLKRLGFGSRFKKKSIWFHAASVGEVELIKPLVLLLCKEQALVVTTFTATGYQHAKKILPADIDVGVIPVDFIPMSQFFIQSLKPRLGIIAETEIWPELLYQAAKTGTTLIHINARLSAKTLQTGSWLKPVIQRTLHYFSLHLTRNEQDLKHFITLGCDADKVKIIGNLKYAQIDQNQINPSPIKKDYILFASTHAPEEHMFAELIQRLRLDELVVIAPRHPKRAGEILKSLKPLKLKTSQRSLNQEITADTQLYLADTLGELKDFIAHAKLVIMGGSFVEIGGHNILEPAALGKAIVTGPSDDNIKQDIALLKDYQAIIQVQNIDELEEKISDLMKDPAALDQMAQNAKACIDSQADILQDYRNALQAYL